MISEILDIQKYSMDTVTYQYVCETYKETFKWKFDLLYFILKNDITIHTPFHIVDTLSGVCLFQTPDIAIHYDGKYLIQILSWNLYNSHNLIVERLYI